MADNEIRELVKPRIVIFSDRVKPDRLQKSTLWQHFLNLIYSESVRRCLFVKFIETLSSPVGLETVDSDDGACDLGDCTDDGAASGNCSVSEKRFDCSETGVSGVSGSIDNVIGIPDSGICDKGISGEDSSKSSEVSPGISRQFSVLELQKQTAVNNMNYMLGDSASDKSCSTSVYMNVDCGLAYLRTKLEEHYNDESKRFTKLSTRLIGKQAIVLAWHSYKLVDCLKQTNKTEGGKLKWLALSKIVEYLRNAG